MSKIEIEAQCKFRSLALAANYEAREKVAVLVRIERTSRQSVKYNDIELTVQ